MIFVWVLIWLDLLHASSSPFSKTKDNRLIITNKHLESLLTQSRQRNLKTKNPLFLRYTANKVQDTIIILDLDKSLMSGSNTLWSWFVRCEINGIDSWQQLHRYNIPIRSNVDIRIPSGPQKTFKLIGYKLLSKSNQRDLRVLIVQCMRDSVMNRHTRWDETDVYQSLPMIEESSEDSDEKLSKNNESVTSNGLQGTHNSEVSITGS